MKSIIALLEVEVKLHQAFDHFLEIGLAPDDFLGNLQTTSAGTLNEIITEIMNEMEPEIGFSNEDVYNTLAVAATHNIINGHEIYKMIIGNRIANMHLK